MSIDRWMDKEDVHACCHFSRVWLLVTPWTIACQAPLSMEFSRQEYWSELPCLPQVIFPTRESTLSLLCHLHWQAGSIPLAPPGSRHTQTHIYPHTHTHTHNGILLSHKKEWNNAIRSNMDGSRDYHIKWNQTENKNIR